MVFMSSAEVNGASERPDEIEKQNAPAKAAENDGKMSDVDEKSGEGEAENMPALAEKNDGKLNGNERSGVVEN